MTIVKHKASQREEVYFNINEALAVHGWKGDMSQEEAEKMLAGKPAYTYLTRFGAQKDRFTLTFVSADGLIKNDTFVLVDWINGIFANGGPCHRGPLEVLIPLKMSCPAELARPV